MSLPRFDVLPGEEMWFASSADGTQLHAVAYLPDLSVDPAWKAPTILIMDPYNGFDARDDPFDASSKPSNHQYRWLLEHFVPRGYAVVYSDVRGTGDSGGCLEQTATLQAQDGFDLVEALAAQPWSNGKVGMYGKSYRAEAQQATAVLQPPHLVTIVPVASVSGQYEYSFYDGVPYTLQAFESNFFYMVMDGVQPPTTAGGLAQYPSRFGCHPGMLAQGLDFTGDWNDFWDVREIRKGADKVATSVLYVHGLQDWNVKPVAIRDWFDRLPGEKRAILGQWGHDFPEWNTHREEWSRPDWREVVHKWFDHWLLGIDNGILQALPPVQVQDTAGMWRSEATFPPVDAQSLTFHLAPGKLAREAPASPEPLRLRENEEAFLAQRTGLPIPTASSEPFADILVFDSDPVEADLHVSGWPTMSFTASFTDLTLLQSEVDAHVAAVLYDVAPDGKASWINRGYVSARHREGVDQPQSVPAGTPFEFNLRMFPADVVVPAGHKLRLTLTGSDDWTQPQGSFWGAEITSATIRLPVIERAWDQVRLSVEMGEPVRE